MAVQVAQPAQKKRDILDVLLGGLQAASAFTSIQKARAEMDAIPEAKARIARAEEYKVAEQERSIAEAEQKKALAADTRKIDVEDKLRSKWLTNPQTKTTQDVSVAVGKIRDVAAGDPTAAGDLSLVFNYMKMLDPGSTVREGEFANAQNAAGVPDRLANLYNNLKAGERLNPEQRLQFASTAEQMYNVHYQRQLAFNKEFERVAGSSGARPENVVLDLGFAPPGKSKTGLTVPTANEDIVKLNQNLKTTPQAIQKKLDEDLQQFNSLMGQ